MAISERTSFMTDTLSLRQGMSFLSMRIVLKDVTVAESGAHPYLDSVSKSRSS